MSKKKKSVVDEILKERGKRYGNFRNQAAVSQEIKRVVFSHLHSTPLEVDFTVWCMTRESLDMICTKIARILNGDMEYADNWLDIAGYAQLVADHLQGKDR